MVEKFEKPKMKNLRDYKVKEGDLVLLINTRDENPYPNKSGKIEEAVLAIFEEFRNDGEAIEEEYKSMRRSCPRDFKNHFWSKVAYALFPDILDKELGLAIPSTMHKDGSITTFAERIYVGRRKVLSALKEDENYRPYVAFIEEAAKKGECLKNVIRR